MLDGDVDPAALTLSELARRAGMAKSNVYRYFETREALLLAVLWEELSAWYEHMAATYEKARPGLDALVRHLARTLTARPRLCALMTATPSVLEHNLGEEAILEFKVRSMATLREMGHFLHGCVPDLTVEEYAALLYDSTAVIGGLYPQAYQAEYSQKLVAEPAFKLLRRDFPRDVERFLLALASRKSSRRSA